MRETPLSLRERTFRAWPSPARGGFFGRHGATFGIAAAGAILMAGVGAFGTGNAPPVMRYPYWFILMSVGACFGALSLDLSGAAAAKAYRLAARAAAAIATVSLLMTPIVWVIAALMIHGSWAPAKMLSLVPQVVLVATAFIGLQLALTRRPSPALRAAAPARPPQLLMRLPDKLRDARIEAVEAEDHY
jgi:hypothetical protein